MIKRILLSVLLAATSPSAAGDVPTTRPTTQPGASVAGHWEGHIRTPGMPLGVIVELRRGGDDQWTGRIDIPIQNARGLSLDRVQVDGEAISFTIRDIPGNPTFSGTIDPARATIAGSFSQRGLTFPFSLSRDRVVSQQFRRPQEPVPPFPYREEEVVVPAGNHALAGTLTLPEGPGPFPAAVLITGSGPQNRDEELFGHKPFKLIADRLTRAGVAVLRTDDRGTGGSTGDFDAATSADFADDAAAAVAFLRGRSDIAPGRVGLIGHSEGGLVAPIVAARDPAIAFVVLLAGPGVGGYDVLVRQMELLLSAEATDAATVTAALARQREMLDLLRGEASEQEAAAKLTELVRAQIESLPARDREAIQDLDGYVAAQVRQVNTPWMRAFLRYDPRPTLRQVRAPVLAINGSLDLQIDPKQNLPEIERALREGGNADVTTREFAGLNHLFQPAKTGLIREYAEIQTTIDETALQELVAWVTARAAS